MHFQILCWYGRERAACDSVRVVVGEFADAPPVNQLTHGTWVLIGGELVGDYVEATLVLAEIPKRVAADGKAGPLGGDQESR